MCLGGGQRSTPQQQYQSPAPIPSPVSASAVELKEEDDLVTDDGQAKKSGRDKLRVDKSNPLGVSASTASKSGVNLFQ